LKLDFLRHIANPLIDKYVEEGKLSPRDAIEVKKHYIEPRKNTSLVFMEEAH